MSLDRAFNAGRQPAAPMGGVSGELRAAGWHASPWRAAARFAVPLDPLRIALFLLTVVSIGRIHQRFAPIALLRPASPWNRGIRRCALAVSAARMTRMTLALCC